MTIKDRNQLQRELLQRGLELATAVRDRLRLDRSTTIAQGSPELEQLVALADAVIYGDAEIVRYGAPSIEDAFAARQQLVVAREHLEAAMQDVERATCAIAACVGLSAEWKRCVERYNGLLSLAERLRELAR